MSLLVDRPDRTAAPAPAAPERAPRRRPGRALLAAAVALVGALAVAGTLALTGGSDASGPTGTLGWAQDPLVFTPERLPNDRTATGSVTNTELREGRVYATKMVVVDADGRELDTAARFLLAYSHGLYPPTQRPPGADESYQAELSGEYADLRAGKETPLTVSWRLEKGSKGPYTLRHDGGELPIPGS